MVSGRKPDTNCGSSALAHGLVQCICVQVQRQGNDEVADHAFAALRGDVRQDLT